MAETAARSLRHRPLRRLESAVTGVKIWSGASADRIETISCMMPSISESPLEQDFTVEGKPSKLGCPFASMANKKLSSHAASVLSRYNQGAPSTPVSSVSRVNGRESFAAKSERRASFADPIKAEICGISKHDNDDAVHSENGHLETQENAEVGVCPIRFLDQHSPEEVATYFERHKHELPRSHEVCVKRYQSNEKQIRELDAKYGSLVSMIQGLGAKHKDMLPQEPETGEADEVDGENLENIRRWASSVSAQVADGRAGNGEEEEEERQPRFERPLRDIRVGESPSRPWGVQVPAEYLETSTPALRPPDAKAEETMRAEKPGRCPFGFDENEAPAERNKPATDAKPMFMASAAEPEHTHHGLEDTGQQSDKSPRIVFTGPVFIGYSAEDAAKILRESGLGTR